MHRTKVHSKKPRLNATKKSVSDVPKADFSKSDLIGIIKVKIDSLKDVLQMLENL